ncbi:MAG: hypothetical protein HZC48_06340 [Nitrospirae bacterium]|nr:hypothetical protein [Nitrospirota bacterium]
MKIGRLIFQNLALSLVFVGGLAGCLQHGSTLSAPYLSAERAGAMSENWRIFLELSGGFSGLRRTIELTDTGRMTVIEQKSAKQIVRQIPEKELAEIALLAENVKSLQPSGRLMNCRDCLQYNLIVRMNGQQFSIQLNDLSLPGSGIEPLLSILFNLQKRALAGDQN